MKYLFLCEIRQIEVPPEQRLAMLQDSKKWINKYIKDGTIESIYNFIEYGGVLIGNFNSPEAAREFLADFPARSLYDWEVRPLLEHKKAIDGSIARLKKALKKK